MVSHLKPPEKPLTPAKEKAEKNWNDEETKIASACSEIIDKHLTKFKLWHERFLTFLNHCVYPENISPEEENLIDFLLKETALLRSPCCHDLIEKGHISEERLLYLLKNTMLANDDGTKVPAFHYKEAIYFDTPNKVSFRIYHNPDFIEPETAPEELSGEKEQEIINSIMGRIRFNLKKQIITI